MDNKDEERSNRSGTSQSVEDHSERLVNLEAQARQQSYHSRSILSFIRALTLEYKKLRRRVEELEDNSGASDSDEQYEKLEIGMYRGPTTYP